jgi:hypothetical protein
MPDAVELRMEWQGRETSIQGDAEKLYQVFFNLLKNSREAGASAVQIRCTQTRYAYVIGIEDNGAGCTQEQLQFLGRAFFTTKRAQGGTGLGLCVSRAILENHGGSLNLYSRIGSGRNDNGLLAVAVLPKPFPSMDPSLIADRGIAVHSNGDPMRTRLALTARNLYMLPHDLRSKNGAEAGLSAPAKLALIEGNGPDLDNEVICNGYHKIVWVQGNGLAMCRTKTDLLVGEGMFTEEFLAKCLD